MCENTTFILYQKEKEEENTTYIYDETKGLVGNQLDIYPYYWIHCT